MTSDRRMMLETDYAGLSDSDKLAILVMDRHNPTQRSRIQTTALLYLGIYRGITGVSFFRGISDDMDESLDNLHDKGMIESAKDGYVLTDYGDELRSHIAEMPENREMAQNAKNIIHAVAGIPDKNLVGLTHHFYPDMGFNPSIGASVVRFNRSASYDGIPLKDYRRDSFETKLRSGAEIRTG